MDFRAKGLFSKTNQIWDDHIRKENDIRIKWNKSFDKISSKFPSSQNLGWRGQYERLEFENFIEANKFRRPQIHQPNKKRTDFSLEVNEYLQKLGIKEPSSTKLKPITMYERTKTENETLYDGISRDHEGRYKYLNERNNILI